MWITINRYHTNGKPYKRILFVDTIRNELYETNYKGTQPREVNHKLKGVRTINRN